MGKADTGDAVARNIPATNIARPILTCWTAYAHAIFMEAGVLDSNPRRQHVGSAIKVFSYLALYLHTWRRSKHGRLLGSTLIPLIKKKKIGVGEKREGEKEEKEKDDQKRRNEIGEGAGSEGLTIQKKKTLHHTAEVINVGGDQVASLRIWA